MNSEDLRAAVNQRVDEVVLRYKGKMAHWDVVNEGLHGKFFDYRLKDKNFTANVYRRVARLDPSVVKFVNDYNVIEYYYDTDSTPQKMLEVC